METTPYSSKEKMTETEVFAEGLEMRGILSVPNRLGVKGPEIRVKGTQEAGGLLAHKVVNLPPKEAECGHGLKHCPEVKGCGLTRVLWICQSRRLASSSCGAVETITQLSWKVST